MLKIQGISMADFPCTVETDEYVPISVKTYPEVLPGAKYFRVGNLSTSLLEIGIDPVSLSIRAICVVLFDKVGTVGEIRRSRDVSESQGLPVVGAECLKNGHTDELAEFFVRLDGNTLVIDWSANKALDRSIRYHNLCFYMNGDELCQIAICDLSDKDKRTLEGHLSAVAK